MQVGSRPRSVLFEVTSKNGMTAGSKWSSIACDVALAMSQPTCSHALAQADEGCSHGVGARGNHIGARKRNLIFSQSGRS